MDMKNIIETKYSIYEGVTYDGYINIRPTWIYVEAADGDVDFKLRLPKIPATIYYKIVSLFKKVAQLHNSECLARVYWSIEKEEYVLVIPSQIADISSVNPIFTEDNSDFLFTHIPVLEVHSHGKAFKAFFSNVDDADELNRHGLYGVFSFYNGVNSQEQCLFRCCSGTGHCCSLNADDIFETGNCQYHGDFVKQILSSGLINIRK